MCAFRSVNRSYKYMSIRAQIYELPITYALITFKLSKRDNQHVFERFNSSVELCRFMRDRQNPVASFLFSVFEDYATFNHTCPFTESHYILEKLPVQHVSNVLSILPNGRYIFHLLWTSDNRLKGEIMVYITKS
ncbi:GH22589 [Drosophila grimshawi]|uniref:GH22589 n=1 Tax=Drosophila grimshawi TaxID=7222 RepID=B4K475_DROGR|nr:GH22589 [Drosophila grimshawi]